MKNLIYYPSFEPESESWLKYALIYFENFSPIIPPAGKWEISDDFKQIEEETNLLRIVRPETENGYQATNATIREIEIIRANRSAYSRILRIENALEVWSNPANWTEILYEEKFNDEFRRFCIENGFGAEDSRGLLLSSELCSLYMTYLAESIAYYRQATPITDIPQLDDLSTYLRTKDVTKAEVLTSARIVLETQLPKNIEKIPLQKFIEFRNKDGITELRSAFNESLEKFYTAVENDFDPISYFQSIKKTNREFITEITKYIGEVAAYTLGALILLKSPSLTNLEMAEKIVGGGLLLAGTVGISQAWKLSEERRNARKFLSKVRNI